MKITFRQYRLKSQILQKSKYIYILPIQQLKENTKDFPSIQLSEPENLLPFFAPELLSCKGDISSSLSPLF